MSGSAAISSGGNDHWETPWEVVRALAGAWWGPGAMPTLDVAASRANAKAPLIYDEQHSALDPRATWLGRVWCNPPYSDIGPWVERNVHEVNREPIVIDAATAYSIAAPSVGMLLPAGTERAWFRLAMRHAAGLWLLTPRIHFLIDGRRPVGKDGRPRANTASNVGILFRRGAPSDGPVPAYVLDWKKEGRT